MGPARTISWSEDAADELQQLDRKTQKLIVDAVKRFAEVGLDSNNVKHLKGKIRDASHRLRVGKWRVFFRLDGVGGLTILVLHVASRDRAYR